MLHRLMHLTSQIHVDFDRNQTQIEENSAKFKVIDYFENNSAYDLVIIPRNNVPVFLTKNIRPPTQNQRLSITRRYKFKDVEALRETYKLMKEFRVHHGCEHNELKIFESILRANNADTNRNPKFDIDVRYEIHLDRFDDNGAIYDRRTDLTVCLSNKYHYLPNPYSEIGRGHEEYTNYINSKKGTGVFIEIVDNNNLITKRFTYIANELKEVYPIQDSTKENGIYITRFCHEKNGDIKMEVQVLTLDEGENIGLYPTREEAITNGKTDEHLRNEKLRLDSEKMKMETDKLNLDKKSLEMKKELQDQLTAFNREKSEFDNKLLKARTEDLRMKQELDERKRELDREIQESNAYLERQKARMEEEAMLTKTNYIKTKDGHDERTLQRSELMENLKFITVMFSSLVSLYFIFKK